MGNNVGENQLDLRRREESPGACKSTMAKSQVARAGGHELVPLGLDRGGDALIVEAVCVELLGIGEVVGIPGYRIRRHADERPSW